MSWAKTSPCLDRYVGSELTCLPAAHALIPPHNPCVLTDAFVRVPADKDANLIAGLPPAGGGAVRAGAGGAAKLAGAGPGRRAAGHGRGGGRPPRPRARPQCACFPEAVLDRDWAGRLRCHSLPVGRECLHFPGQHVPSLCCPPPELGISSPVCVCSGVMLLSHVFQPAFLRVNHRKRLINPDRAPACTLQARRCTSS